MADAEPDLATELVDGLLPGEGDWQDLVRAFPKTALALAALGGFFLARDRGPAIVTALSTWAADAVVRNVNDLLGDEVL